MANNDRLANGGSFDATPGWKADETVRFNTPLLTQNVIGIGWQASDVSRMVVTKNSAGLPGWRARVFVPGNLAQITMGTTEVVITDTYDYIIPHGSFIEKGTQVRIHQNLGSVRERGCRATIQRQDATDLNYWLTNYVDSHNNGHNFKTWVVQEDTHVVADARNRVTAVFACGTNNVITASISGSSWGPRGSQSTSLSLTQTFQNINNLEFFQGDYLNTSYSVNSGYDWAEFTAGSSPQSNPVTPTYGGSGGSYNFNMDDLVTYIAMDALISTNFYVYQPGSSTFTNTKVTVEEVSTFRIHKTGITLPYVGQNLDYGKNGSAGSHPRLYAGTKLSLSTTSSNSYVASTVVTSTSTTQPSVAVPTDTNGYSVINMTLGGTPIFAVGVYYVKSGLVQSSKTVSKSKVMDSYNTFIADPNGRLNANLTFVDTSAWTSPPDSYGTWLYDASWSFSQTSREGTGPGPTAYIQWPANRSGSSVGQGEIRTDEIQNGLFSYQWTGGIRSYTSGTNFKLVMTGQCINYGVGVPPPWLNELGDVNVSWTFTPVLTIISGSA